MGIFQKWREQRRQEAQQKATLKDMKERVNSLQSALSTAQSAYAAKRYPEALAAYEQAAQMGSAAAQYSCGLMYYKGQGAYANRATALQWFQKAAQQGNAEIGRAHV